MTAAPQSTLSEQLLAQLQGEPLQDIANQLGTSTQQAHGAVSTALPLLFAALGQHAAQPQGVQTLLGALQSSPAAAAPAPAASGGATASLGALDLGGLLGGLLGAATGAGRGAASAGTGAGLDAGAILGQIFGQRQQRAEDGLAQATGLGQGSAGQLLKILAPIVMAFLAKQVSAQGLDGAGLGQALGQERAQTQQPAAAGGDLLSRVLDQDGDGKVDLGDLLKLGGSLFGNRR